MVYIDKEVYAISNNYATWITYASDNPNNPSLLHLIEMIEEATTIINENIGSYNVDITDVRFLSRIQKLCLRMVKRMEQIDIAQDLPARIPMFSPNDFLIERERTYLQFTVGLSLGYRGVGEVQG